MSVFDDGSIGISINSPLSSYMQPGIGDGDDLKLQIKKDSNGKWFPLLHKGWYYHGAQERYLFAKKEINVITCNTPLTAYAVSITSTSLDTSAITHYGPVFLNNATTNFTRVNNTIRCFRAADWSQISGTYLWSASVNGLVARVSSYKWPIMNSVQSSSLVKTDRDYYFDEDTRVITVAATSIPSGTVFITHTYDPVTSGLLEQYEILKVEEDLTVSTMYKDVEYQGTFLPVATKITSSGLYTENIPSGSISGNTLTLTGFSYGDYAGVRYFVRNSFAVTSSNVHVYASTSGVYNLQFEGSDKEYYDLSDIPEIDTSYLQLNPLFSGISEGFIYLDEEQDVMLQANTLYTYCSPTRVDVISGCGPLVRVKARVVDKNRNPVSNVPIVTTESGNGYVETRTPSSQTDYLGEYTLTWAPTGVGTTTITMSASGAELATLSGTVFIEQISHKDIRTLTSVASSIEKVYLTKMQYGSDKVVLYAQLSRADGTPIHKQGEWVVFVQRNNPEANINIYRAPIKMAQTNNMGLATAEIQFSSGKLQDSIIAYYYSDVQTCYLYSNEVVIQG